MYTGRLQVALYVSSVSESVEYYQRVLGFTFQGYWDPRGQRYVDEWAQAEPPRQADLLAGKNHIVLRPIDGRERRGKAEYAIDVDDLDLIYRRAVASGGKVVEPWVHSTGKRMFMLTDPDGHIWKLIQSRELVGA